MVVESNFQIYSENFVRNPLFCLLLLWLFFSCFNLNPVLFQLHMCPFLLTELNFLPPSSLPSLLPSFPPSSTIENVMRQGTIPGSGDATVDKMDKTPYPRGFFMLLESGGGGGGQ